MKKFNTAPVSGMQELLPNMQAEFNRFKGEIAGVFERHGFQNIETPMIERTEVLLAKAGGDTEKQIYKVVKTAETASDADQALRFDHTVPLARYVVEHMNDLPFPFKVSQVGRNFRGERAQKGRFREFYQCDVDIIGWNNLPVAYDAEVITTLIEALKTLPLPPFVVRVSNRKLVSGMLAELNLEHLSAEIFNIIDHAEKVEPAKTTQSLEELKIGSENVVKITTFMQIRGLRKNVIPKLQELGFNNELFQSGVQELDLVLQLLEERLAESKVSARAEADMIIVRGLDYYTGTVFETIVPEYREIGSVCSGGRYENLASHYTDQNLPGVGGSIGLTRLFYVLQNYGLVKPDMTKVVDFCLIPLSNNEFLATERLATKLRGLGRSVDVVLTEKKLGDKMTYASKIARYAAVIGENELRSGQISCKDFVTGETTLLTF